MFDYRALEALYHVHREQSFEVAAKKLFVTQSAISQRIKGIEDYYGEPLLIRMLPYQLTPLGKQLISHFKKVCLLQDELNQELGVIKTPYPIAIALNRDSLETWFLELLEEKPQIFKDTLLEIISADENLTLDHLRNGTVSACLSTTEKAIPGGNAVYVGTVDYVLVASPEFNEAYINLKSPVESLRKAPGIKFDHDDTLLAYLKHHFGINPSEVNFNIIPSVRGIRKFALHGYGYCIDSRAAAQKDLDAKRLIEIFPNLSWRAKFYWHYWSLQSKFYQNFNKAMVQAIKDKLS